MDLKQLGYCCVATVTFGTVSLDTPEHGALARRAQRARPLYGTGAEVVDRAGTSEDIAPRPSCRRTRSSLSDIVRSVKWTKVYCFSSIHRPTIVSSLSLAWSCNVPVIMAAKYLPLKI